MDRYPRRPPADGPGQSPSTEAWLFAQAILGKPIPNPAAAEAQRLARQEHEEFLAAISPRHAELQRQRQREEAEALRKREHLEWLAGIFPEHECKLRALEREEAEQRELQESGQLDSGVPTATVTEWNPNQPRNPAGQPDGGEWTKVAPQEMLDLAFAWWKTTGALINAPFQIKELQNLIARQTALAHGHGKYADLHMIDVEKARRELEALQKLVPQLEQQKRDLEKQYHDSGYDDVPYSAWTTGEMRVGGSGIEDVAKADGMGGKPAGLQPTGIEFDAALGAGSLLQLGKWAIRKAVIASNRSALGARVSEIHGALDTIAQVQRTTAILETRNGTRIVASGGRDLTPAQKPLLRPGDAAARLPRRHAELSALEHAAKKGLVPAQITASRPFCPECIRAIQAAGGKITSPTTAIFPR